MELCTASAVFLTNSLLLIVVVGDKDTNTCGSIARDFFYSWKSTTLIPIVVNADGGILIVPVTKYAGSVRKGLSLIFGLLLTGSGGTPAHTFLQGKRGQTTVILVFLFPALWFNTAKQENDLRKRRKVKMKKMKCLQCLQMMIVMQIT